MFEYPPHPLFTGAQPLRELSTARAARAARSGVTASRRGAGLRPGRGSGGGAGGRRGWKGRGASRTGSGSGGRRVSGAGASGVQLRVQLQPEPGRARSPSRDSREFCCVGAENAARRRGPSALKAVQPWRAAVKSCLGSSLRCRGSAGLSWLPRSSAPRRVVRQPLNAARGRDSGGRRFCKEGRWYPKTSAGICERVRNHRKNSGRACSLSPRCLDLIGLAFPVK